MHFSHAHQDSARKASRIVIVAAVHIAVGAAFIQSMNTRLISSPAAPDDVTIYQAERTEPPPIPEPQPRTIEPTLPPIFVPRSEVDIPVQRTDPVTEVTRSNDPPATTAGPAERVGPKADPGPAVKPPAAMRSAVLVNASACALPDYPARAARNGETGTVALALLVGVNGRVIDSKVLSSSGSRELDRAAQSALSLCSFQPAMEGGQPQQAWAQIAYVWKLD